MHYRVFRQIGRFGLIFLFFLSASEGNAQITGITDIGLETSFQDTSLGHHKKGRAGVGADFDLDGYIDYFIGNPGDQSIILRNVPGQQGQRSFQLQQLLLVDSLSWGGVAFDYDNDGDYDLFVPCGANEGIGHDVMFRNEWIPTGQLTFTDVTAEAGVAGPVPASNSMAIPDPVYILATGDCGVHHTEPPVVLRFDQLPHAPEMSGPVQTASANAVVADYDRDGDNDLFVSANIHKISDPRYPSLIGRNTLWENNGDGTFTDVTVESGLAASLRPTRHSSFLDYDNDGDQDLYENNFGDENILWRNNGDGTFTDVTAAAAAPGEDLHFPWKSFASAAGDLNNDGWEDLVVFMRDFDTGKGSPYPDGGHALFLNSNGQFTNIAASTVFNNDYVGHDGVMGCMVGDVSGDGLPDIYVGNGGPGTGIGDKFYVSVPGSQSPAFVNATSLIDFPATLPPGFGPVSYPYRTHGTSFVDVDNDGLLEIAVVNGGTARSNDAEPNRLFKVETAEPYNWMKVRPVGDGISVARDAIGTEIKLDYLNGAGQKKSVFRKLYGGSAFSSQNGFVLHFGLSDATQIRRLTIWWPNGVSTVVREGLAINSSIVVNYGDQANMMATEVESQLTGEAPASFDLMQNYPNPFNPSTTISYSVAEETTVSLKIFDLLGREITTLVDESQSEGQKSVVWNGTDQAGRQVASGIYVYRLKAGSFTATQKMMLSK